MEDIVQRSSTRAVVHAYNGVTDFERYVDGDHAKSSLFELYMLEHKINERLLCSVKYG